MDFHFVHRQDRERVSLKKQNKENLKLFLIHLAQQGHLENSEGRRRKPLGVLAALIVYWPVGLLIKKHHTHRLAPLASG